MRSIDLFSAACVAALVLSAACSSDSSTTTSTGTRATGSGGSGGAGTGGSDGGGTGGSGSGTGGAGGGTQCAGFDYTGYMPKSTPTAQDLVALVKKGSCSTPTACHGNGGFKPLLTESADQIRMSVVGVASDEVPSLMYVKPNDPQNSYLMRKLERADPGCGLTCTPPPMAPATACKTQMPSTLLGGLPAADQAVFRDWIATGAK